MKIYNPPGIFNDVLGPVMRGPSSSHTGGSYRIGNLIRQIAGPEISDVDFHFHPEGSLATTYNTQGSDIGLATGILGLDITDPGLPGSLNIAKEKGINLSFNITDYPADHPNTYLCHFKNKSGGDFQLKALSTGGGIIRLIEFQDFEFSLLMDLPSLFVIADRFYIDELWEDTGKIKGFREQVFKQQIIERGKTALLIVEFNTASPVLPEPENGTTFFKLIHPVYPSLGYTGSLLSFRTAGELELLDDKLEMRMSDLALEYECLRSDMTRDEVIQKTGFLVDIFMESVEKGLSGTEYNDRIVHSQSPGFFEKSRQGKLLPSGPLNRMIAYTMAVMESKSAMQIIIAAPTAGSAGALPGSILGMAEEINASKEEIIKGFLAAGLAGVFITAEATFAAEVAGCQAETGSSASMAAAGLVEMGGGNARQAMGAASIALQNIMGLVCDPVANRVEIPCLGRNVQAAANGLASANMILGGVDPVIPLSESIKTMLEVGKTMPRELRCTALGGLAITKTAKEIENKLLNRRDTPLIP